MERVFLGSRARSGIARTKGRFAGRASNSFDLQFRIVKRAWEDPHRGLVERSTGLIYSYLPIDRREHDGRAWRNSFIKVKRAYPGGYGCGTLLVYGFRTRVKLAGLAALIRKLPG